MHSCHTRILLSFLPQHGLKETATECEGLGATVHTFVVDCSKREEIYSAAEKVREQVHVPGLPHTCFALGKAGKQHPRCPAQFLQAPAVSPLFAAVRTYLQVLQPVPSSSGSLCPTGFMLQTLDPATKLPAPGLLRNRHGNAKGCTAGHGSNHSVCPQCQL